MDMNMERTEDFSELKKNLGMLETLLRQVIENTDMDKIELTSPNDVYKIATSLIGISRAYVEIDRREQERGKYGRKIFELIKTTVQNELSARPKLADELVEVIHAASEKVEIALLDK